MEGVKLRCVGRSEIECWDIGRHERVGILGLVIKGAGEGEGVIGAVDIGDVGEEGLVSIYMTGDVRGGRRLRGLEAIPDKIRCMEPYAGLSGRGLVRHHW